MTILRVLRYDPVLNLYLICHSVSIARKQSIRYFYLPSFVRLEQKLSLMTDSGWRWWRWFSSALYVLAACRFPLWHSIGNRWISQGFYELIRLIINRSYRRLSLSLSYRTRVIQDTQVEFECDSSSDIQFDKMEIVCSSSSSSIFCGNCRVIENQCQCYCSHLRSSAPQFRLFPEMDLSAWWHSLTDDADCFRARLHVLAGEGDEDKYEQEASNWKLIEWQWHK